MSKVIHITKLLECFNNIYIANEIYKKIVLRQQGGGGGVRQKLNFGSLYLENFLVIFVVFFNAKIPSSFEKL